MPVTVTAAVAVKKASNTDRDSDLPAKGRASKAVPSSMSVREPAASSAGGLAPKLPPRRIRRSESRPRLGSRVGIETLGQPGRQRAQGVQRAEHDQDVFPVKDMVGGRMGER